MSAIFRIVESSACNWSMTSYVTDRLPECKCMVRRHGCDVIMKKCSSKTSIRSKSLGTSHHENKFYLSLAIHLMITQFKNQTFVHFSLKAGYISVILSICVLFVWIFFIVMEVLSISKEWNRKYFCLKSGSYPVTQIKKISCRKLMLTSIFQDSQIIWLKWALSFFQS